MKKKIDEEFKQMIYESKKITIDESHFAETLKIVKAEYNNSGSKEKMRFSSFFVALVRIVGWKIWALQITILLTFCYLFSEVSQKNVIYIASRHIPFLLCCSALMILMSGLPFIKRSYKYQMFEVEAATRLSNTWLFLTHLAIIGVGDLCMLIVLFLVVVLKTGLGIENAALYLFVPFLIAISGGSVLVKYFKVVYLTSLYTVISMVTILILFALNIYDPHFYEFGFDIKWGCICAILVAFCLIQLRGFKKNMRMELLY